MAIALGIGAGYAAYAAMRVPIDALFALPAGPTRVWFLGNLHAETVLGFITVVIATLTAPPPHRSVVAFRVCFGLILLTAIATLVALVRGYFPDRIYAILNGAFTAIGAFGGLSIWDRRFSLL